MIEDGVTDDGVTVVSRSPAEDCERSVRDEAEVAIFRGGGSVLAGAGRSMKGCDS